MIGRQMGHPGGIEIERGREGFVVMVQPVEINGTVGEPVHRIDGLIDLGIGS